MAQPTKKPATRTFRGRSAQTAGMRREGKPWKSGLDDDDRHLIYGVHSTLAALSNPNRQIDELYLTLNAENRIKETLNAAGLSVQRVTPKELDKRLGADTVHQGALAVCQPLPEVTLPSLLATAQKNGQPILVLDQITDPHNVGAVLRSAAAFGVSGLVMTRRHSPPLSGALAKVASGALEVVPICLIQNLVRTLVEISDNEIPIVGLDSDAPADLVDALKPAPAAIVLGAEGKGLRQSTREACTTLARITAQGTIASLNVSNAAAIALHVHALTRQGRLT